MYSCKEIQNAAIMLSSIVLLPFGIIYWIIKYFHTLLQIRNLRVGDLIKFQESSGFIAEKFIVISASRKSLPRCFDIASICGKNIKSVNLNMTSSDIMQFSDVFINTLCIEQCTWTESITKYLINCKNMGFIYNFKDTPQMQMQMHQLLVFIVRKRFDIPARVIQRAWRFRRARKRKVAIRVIEDAALHYLFSRKTGAFNKVLAHYTNTCIARI